MSGTLVFDTCYQYCCILIQWIHYAAISPLVFLFSTNQSCSFLCHHCPRKSISPIGDLLLAPSSRDDILMKVSILEASMYLHCALEQQVLFSDHLTYINLQQSFTPEIMQAKDVLSVSTTHSKLLVCSCLHFFCIYPQRHPSS